MDLAKTPRSALLIEKELNIKKLVSDDKVIAICGNPNVGKSTVFNNLTGLNQHTGNWPGKTVTNAHGKYTYKGKDFIIVDIPGTYSLMANSVEEEVARDFICFGNPDTTIVVVDGTCLERNLNLVLQTLEITHNVVVCVNLIDEAKKKNIFIDLEKLSKELGVPVVGTSALKGEGLDKLMEEVYNISFNHKSTNPLNITYEKEIEDAIFKVESAITPFLENKLNPRWVALKLIDGNKTLLDSINRYIGFNIVKEKSLISKINEAKYELSKKGIDENIFRDKTVSTIVNLGEKISRNIVTFKDIDYNKFNLKVDKYLTSKVFGIPIMITLLYLVLWITITGANFPSQLLAKGLFALEDKITNLFIWLNAPSWIHGVLVLGIYRTLAWVVSVMLPPMAIFFPLFTLLEDLGYLPRIAFNLDNFFKKAKACGKQGLTMCMGFGCNAAGVIGCRIIDSPRERLIAVITNNFVPCNGRFPTLIAIIPMFFVVNISGPFNSILSTLILTAVILLGVIMTFISSKILSNTILKGVPSNFTLELPPYRKPQIGKIIIRSIFDRTLFVLGRAVIVAIPAGLIIWVMANIFIGNFSLLTYCADFLDPFASLIGMDGYILMAFILGFPANEIVVPIIIMSYMATGSMLELDNIWELKELLVNNGWTWVTAISVMLFSLMHWPCATTCLTIKKETQSLKWTAISFLVPTISGILICFIFTSFIRFLGFI